MANYLNVPSAFALSYNQAFKLAKKYADDYYDGFSYQGDHGIQNYVDFSDAFETFLMNPATGSVETKEQWEKESKTWEGDIEKQLKSLIKVVRINDEWFEA